MLHLQNMVGGGGGGGKQSIPLNVHSLVTIAMWILYLFF